MYSLQVPAAHQDHSQLPSGQPLIEITFQLSSAAPSPLSRPGQGCHDNWAAKLTEGLVGAALGSPIRWLSASTTSSLQGSLCGKEVCRPVRAALHPITAWA